MKASVDRYFVLEDSAPEPIEYVSTHQAYSDEEYDALLTSAGFGDIRRFASLSGTSEPHEAGLFVLTAVRL